MNLSVLSRKTHNTNRGESMKKSIFGIACLMLLLFSCKDPSKGKTPDGNTPGNTPDTSAPKLKLVSMKICGTPIADSELDKETWTAVTVENAQKTLASKNIQAEFDYGDQKKQTMTVNIEPATLNVGNNDVTLSVAEEKGKWQAWTHKVTIKRLDENKVNFKLNSFKVKVNATPVKWEFAKKVGDKFVVEVPNTMQSIVAIADMEATFEWDNMQAPKPRILSFTVADAFPIQLAEPGTEKEIKLTVAKAANDEYPEWIGSVYIKRKTDTVTLARMKLAGNLFPKKELTPITKTWDAGTTSAPSVNVYFYHEADASQENPDLITKITTEPQLVEGLNVRTWNLTEPTNTLKVMVGGVEQCTITLKREAVTVEKIGVFAVKDNSFVAENAEEGQTYKTSSNDVRFIVEPKEGHKYDKMTVQIGEQGTATDLTVATGDTNYTGTLTLTGEDNAIILKAIDESKKDAFTMTRKFNIKKIADPSTGGIDAKVKIKELWVGNGKQSSYTDTFLMNKENGNKFKATVDASDPHKYTVNVDKIYSTYSFNIGLIVSGDAGAEAATIKDASMRPTDPKGVADGQTIFTSPTMYKALKKDKNDTFVVYEFTLENGDKQATYQVTINFDQEVKFKLTITNPTGGIIKVWEIDAQGERQELQTNADIVYAPLVYYLKHPSNFIAVELLKDPSNSDTTKHTIFVNGKEDSSNLKVNPVWKVTPEAVATTKIRRTTFLEDIVITGKCEK